VSSETRQAVIRVELKTDRENVRKFRND